MVSDNTPPTSPWQGPQFPDFHHFPEVQQYFRPKQLDKGAFWLRAGRVCGHIAFLQSGMLRSFVETDTGRHTRWITLPNQFITSVTSFGRQRPSEEYVEVLEDASLMEISHTDWQKLADQYPGLRQYWTRMLEELIGCYESRLHSVLIGDAEGRYRYFMQHYPDFVLKVPQKYVAEMLGIAPRHLSRIRKQYATSH